MHVSEKLLSNYESLYELGLCTKHYMHDSVLFINDEGVAGHQAVVFHNDGGYRELGYYPTPSEAYSSVICYG